MTNFIYREKEDRVKFSSATHFKTIPKSRLFREKTGHKKYIVPGSLDARHMVKLGLF